MREILFRGKRKDNGDWMYGAFLHLNVGKDFICDGTVWIGTLQPCKYEVDPETVGQFTGLTDKNGKKIFEGDIVQFYGTYALEVYVEKGHTKIRWFDTVTNSKCSDMFFGDDEGLGECEVIGNIHDNPELLEVEDG